MARLARFTGTLYRLELAIGDYRRVLKEHLAKEAKRSATIWLNATVLSVIPTWSGASHATFLKLARAVSFPLTIRPPAPSAVGNPLAEGPSIGMQKSTGKLESTTSRATFTYGTTLFHLVFNEFNDGNANPQAGRVYSQLLTPGPYNFQQIGEEAFWAYASTVRLPNPWNYIRKTPVRVG